MPVNMLVKFYLPFPFSFTYLGYLILKHIHEFHETIVALSCVYVVPPRYERHLLINLGSRMTTLVGKCERVGKRQYFPITWDLV